MSESRCTEKNEAYPYTSEHLWNADHHGLPAGPCVCCGEDYQAYMNRVHGPAVTIAKHHHPMSETKEPECFMGDDCEHETQAECDAAAVKEIDRLREAVRIAEGTALTVVEGGKDLALGLAKLITERDMARATVKRYVTEAAGRMIQREMEVRELDTLRASLAYAEEDRREHVNLIESLQAGRETDKAYFETLRVERDSAVEERDGATNSYNRLMIDATEANRIHNQQMNEMSSELQDYRGASEKRGCEGQSPLHANRSDVDPATLLTENQRLREALHEAQGNFTNACKEIDRMEALDPHKRISELETTVNELNSFDVPAELFDERMKNVRLTEELHIAQGRIGEMSNLTDEQRIEGLEKEVEQLKDSMLRHFQDEHLAGDGPEIDRWKRRCAERDEHINALKERLEKFAGIATAKESENQSQSREIESLKLTIRKLNRSREHKHAMMELELDEIKLREKRLVEVVLDLTPSHCIRGACWCPIYFDISGYGHSKACLKAQETIADAPRG